MRATTGSTSLGPLSLESGDRRGARHHRHAARQLRAGRGFPGGNYVPSTAVTYAPAPSLDFYGTARKNGFVDAGAVELVGGGSVTPTPTLTSISPAFGARGTLVLQ